MKLHLIILGSLGVIIAEAGATSSNPSGEFWHPNEHPAILERQITAFTVPSRTMDVSAEFGGRIETIMVREGEMTTGELGATASVIFLDKRFATIARDREKVALETAIQQMEQLETELALAKRQLEFHRNEVKRIESLAKSGKVRQSELDLAIFDADRSELQAKRAQTALSLAETNIVDARHKLADAEERLARHTIMAPAGWVVSKRFVEPGVIVQPGQPLLRLTDLSELSIELRLSEEEIAVIQEKKNILLHFPHHENAEVSAQIHHFDVDYDPVTNKRLAELRIPGDSAPVASGGLEVTITLHLRDPGGFLLIPQDFLKLRLEQYFVTLKGGEESAIIPLREQGSYVIISKLDLPTDAVLTRP